MASREIDRPVFLVGMPRSGTTVMFAALAAHPSLSWFSQYMHRFPRLTALAALSRLTDVWPASRSGVARYGQQPFLERLRVAPSESAGSRYGIWSHCCGEKFRFTFLLGVEPSERERRCLRSKVAATLRFYGKARFAGKLTGPARIGYLSGVFPDAIFLHVLRDPRAVVESLMRVPFWRDTFRYTEPAWRDGLRASDLQAWREAGESPVALAAIEWRVVLERARGEAAALPPDRYTEVRYEDFVADPHGVLGRLFEFSQLPEASEPHEFLDQRLAVRDLTAGWKQRLTIEEIQTIEALASPVIQEFDYVPRTPAAS